jgi:hypothetical protein
MSGQQEQRDGRERASLPDQLDANLVMTQAHARGRDQANGHAPAKHRSPRSLFDPAPAADHGETAEATPESAAATSATNEAEQRPGTEQLGPPGSPADQPNRTPVPGSRADLRQRLERLPYGHPSSPYHVDGERKPPPPRLKHLELAPPVPSPVPSKPVEPPAKPSPADVPDVERAEPAAQDQRTAQPGPADAARPMPTFTPASAARPDPQPRRPVEPTADSGQLTDRHATSQARSLPIGRGPGFNPSSTRPRTHSDGSWTWGPARLTPDQVRIAEDGYDRFRGAEGRNLFGTYDDSGLTAKLRQVEARLEHGRLAPGTEEHALLEPDMFRARLADLLRRHPERSPELLASRVPGALSYAFIFGIDHYADGILAVQDALEALGFELQARKNSWNNAANRCVFTMWHDRLSELPFEVQFHTSASLEAQQLARTSAKLMNDPRVPAEEAASLRADVASTWAALPSPPGNAEISDYRRYGSAAPRR